MSPSLFPSFPCPWLIVALPLLFVVGLVLILILLPPSPLPAKHRSSRSSTACKPCVMMLRRTLTRTPSPSSNSSPICRLVKWQGGCNNNQPTTNHPACCRAVLYTMLRRAVLHCTLRFSHEFVLAAMRGLPTSYQNALNLRFQADETVAVLRSELGAARTTLQQRQTEAADSAMTSVVRCVTQLCVARGCGCGLP